MSSSSSGRRARVARCFEALEARQLLTIELSGPGPGLWVDTSSFDPTRILVRYRDPAELAAGPIGLATAEAGTSARLSACQHSPRKMPAISAVTTLFSMVRWACGASNSRESTPPDMAAINHATGKK